MKSTPINDPFYRFEIDELLGHYSPALPRGFNAFWQACYESALNKTPSFKTLNKHKHVKAAWKITEVSFESTGDFPIIGWLLEPLNTKPTHALIVGHGYGGRTAPDFHLPFPEAALFFPCFRGLGLSTKAPVSNEPYWHVLHDIDKKDQYIIRGCVEDVWLSVTALLEKFPNLEGKIGFLGISFSGGIGALALAQEKRIARAHLNVPTFGDHRARLRLPTNGSGRAIQDFFKKQPSLLLKTLKYYDAANAASNISIPIHFALALRDNVVTPPGQFAIYNQVKSDKQLFVLTEGHADYAEKEAEEQRLLKELYTFFQPLNETS